MKWLLKLKYEKNSFEDFTERSRLSKKDQQNLKFLKRKKVNLSKIYLLLTLIQLIQVGVNLSLSQKDCFHFQMKSYSNEITITIKISGTGDKYMVSKDFYKYPDYIKLNTVSSGSIESSIKMINIPSEGET